jgi:hypothetical protein
LLNANGLKSSSFLKHPAWNEKMKNAINTHGIKILAFRYPQTVGTG